MVVVIITTVAVGSVLFAVGLFVAIAGSVYDCQKRVRENNHRAEDRCGEARREMSPAHSFRAGELTRRGRNGGRVTYNEHGGEERDSTDVMIIASEMFAALGVTEQNSTLEAGKLCGGRETTRQEHYMSMKQHFKTCEKDSVLIWFTGHGQRGTGDWVFLDGVITFMDVFGLYQNYFMGRKLTIVCDCCYSGHWVEKLAMKLDEYGIPSCGHRAKALDIKLRIVASCQKDQQCREKSFQKSLCLNEDGTITFPREMRLSDNQTTAHIDTTEIRCSSGVYGTCSIATGMKWKTS